LWRLFGTPSFGVRLTKDGKTFTITGKLEYQTCDKTTCYVPTSVPVKWQLQLFPLDRTHAPSDIRHKQEAVRGAGPACAYARLHSWGKSFSFVIPNGVWGVRNLSFLVFVPKRDFSFRSE
jgi:hypothetical protein